jgi:hypothetical protein
MPFPFGTARNCLLRRRRMHATFHLELLLIVFYAEGACHFPYTRHSFPFRLMDELCILFVPHK